MSLSSIGLSGMRAAQMQLDTSAHNVANGQTPGFQRQAVTQTAQPRTSGVTAQIVKESPSVSALGADQGRLADDMVAQHMGVYNFAANLRSVEAEDRVLGSLLDAKA
jgi:flagellar hook-associated protein FlgK